MGPCLTGSVLNDFILGLLKEKFTATNIWNHLNKCTYKINFLDWIIFIYRSCQWRCTVKIYVLKNFAKFTWKHLCQSFFFNKVAGWHEILRNFNKNTYFAEHLYIIILIFLCGLIPDFKPGSLFRRHNMKGFYTISIDRNSYCKEGLLKSFSIFPLLIRNKIGFLERSSLVCNNFVSCPKLGRPF